jgi:hypothetical protein
MNKIRDVSAGTLSRSGTGSIKIMRLRFHNPDWHTIACKCCQMAAKALSTAEPEYKALCTLYGIFVWMSMV